MVMTAAITKPFYSFKIFTAKWLHNPFTAFRSFLPIVNYCKTAKVQDIGIESQHAEFSLIEQWPLLYVMLKRDAYYLYLKQLQYLFHKFHLQKKLGAIRVLSRNSIVVCHLVLAEKNPVVSFNGPVQLVHYGTFRTPTVILMLPKMPPELYQQVPWLYLVLPLIMPSCKKVKGAGQAEWLKSFLTLI